MQHPVRRRLAVLLLAALVITTPLAGCGSRAATTPGEVSGAAVLAPRGATSHLATVSVAQLPAEAVDTLRLVASGGPFPYPKDGATFQNREGLLPTHPTGWYKEYTVITPGSPDRGAQRIIAGTRGERYYTDDHYASFREVVSGASS